MNTKYLILIATATTLIAACSGKKSQPSQSAQLIEDVEQLQIDTVATAAGEILCSPDIDKVLRRYPELFHAVKKAKKTYGKWAAQDQTLKASLYDIGPLMEMALFGTTDVPTDIEWPNLDTIDQQYLQKIAAAETTEAKTTIGHSRRAWKDYMTQLQKIAQALPEECYPRFTFAVEQETEKHLNLLSKQPII